MPKRVVRVTPLPNYRLTVEFDDGVSGTVDLSDDLRGEVFEPLRDEALFSQASADEYGAVTWPNGADIAPDALYLEITGGAPLDGAEAQAGERDAFRTRRNDDRPRLDLLTAAVTSGHRDPARRGDAGGALEPIDLVLAE